MKRLHYATNFATYELDNLDQIIVQLDETERFIVRACYFLYRPDARAYQMTNEWRSYDNA